MDDSLLIHYERELAFIQQQAADFAKQHPAVASSLKLTADTVDDPLVASLLSGFAFLNSRIQQKLSDDFPELTDAILDTLYPHYLRPIPSLSIVQFQTDINSSETDFIEKGTLLDTREFQGESCRFTTCYPTWVHPFTVDSVSLMPRPFIAPGSNQISGSAAVLKLSLKGLAGDYDFHQLSEKNLRFFLRGQSQHTNPLYDLLFLKTMKVVIGSSDDDTAPIFIDADCIKPVGFDRHEEVIPYKNTAFDAYRLLTEFFVFPEKFRFIDLCGLKSYLPEGMGKNLNIYFYLSDTNEELERCITPSMFSLGCTPVINLFKQTADPISLSHTEYQYHVVPDSRRENGLEVYEIESIGATDSGGQLIEYKPFYSINHKKQDDINQAYWFTRSRTVTEGEHHNELATEVDISLVDLNFSPQSIDSKVLDVELVCSNRNQAKKLPYDNRHSRLHIVDGSFSAAIMFITPPTSSIRPPRGARAYWRLISHLNLNYLSLGQGSGDAEPFKEILRLYDLKDTSSTRNLIEAVSLIKTKPIMAPIEIDGTHALCRGIQVTIELDAIMLSGCSTLLFSSVIERFLGLYCSINSFTRLIVTLRDREGEFKRWHPRAGEKALV